MNIIPDCILGFFFSSSPSSSFSRLHLLLPLQLLLQSRETLSHCSVVWLQRSVFMVFSVHGVYVLSSVLWLSVRCDLQFITLELWTVWNVKYKRKVKSHKTKKWKRKRKEKKTEFNITLFFVWIFFFFFFFSFLFHWFIIFGLRATYEMWDIINSIECNERCKAHTKQNSWSISTPWDCGKVQDRTERSETEWKGTEDKDECESFAKNSKCAIYNHFVTRPSFWLFAKTCLTRCCNSYIYFYSVLVSIISAIFPVSLTNRFCYRTLFYFLHLGSQILNLLLLVLVLVLLYISS